MGRFHTEKEPRGLKGRAVNIVVRPILLAFETN